MLFKNKELAPPSLEQEGPFMRFLEKYKLLSPLSHHLRLFRMCHVCVRRLEGDFLHGADCFFFQTPPLQGPAVWFERLDWSEGETDFDACVLYPARLFVIDVADGQIGAILF